MKPLLLSTMTLCLLFASALEVMPSERKSGEQVVPGALRLGRIPAKVLKPGATKSSCMVLLRAEKMDFVENADDPFAGGGSTEHSVKFSVTKISASIKPVIGGGPMQVSVPVNREAGNAPERIGRALERLAERLGGWPDDCLLTIDPSAIPDAVVDPDVVVLLAESIISGVAIHPRTLIADYTPQPYAAFSDPGPSKPELIALSLAGQSAGLRVFTKSLSAEELGDIVLDSSLAQLARVQFLGYSESSELTRLATAKPSSDLGKSLVEMDETNAVVKKRGISILKNEHVQKRLRTALATWPNNLTAQFYQSQVPKPTTHYSKVRGIAVLERIAEHLYMESGSAAQRRRSIKDLKKVYEEYRVRSHPDLKAGFEAAQEALQSWETTESREFLDAFEKLVFEVKNLGGRDIKPRDPFR